MATSSAAPLKSVHLIPQDSAVKRLCFDEATRTLRPNLVLVDRSGSVVFEINELGLKGLARDPSRKLAIVWGDSVVFSIKASWPCLLDELAPGYQFLNGGIEGDPYDNILRRGAIFNQAHSVALNIVLLGWHPIIPASHLNPQRRGFRGRPRGFTTALLGTGATAAGIGAAQRQQLEAIHRDLTAFLEAMPNTVLATMPTALNRKIADRDLSTEFTGGSSETVFTFAGDLAYSIELQRYLFDHIALRNMIVRQV